MSDQHQFYIALLGILTNTLFAILAWLKSEKARQQAEVTHHEVNSRMDEFKQTLDQAAKDAMQKFRDDLLASEQIRIGARET